MFSDSDENRATPVQKKCVVCQLATGGAHKCVDCDRYCHAIAPCSVMIAGGDEGYGSTVVCVYCDKLRMTLAARDGAKQHQHEKKRK